MIIIVTALVLATRERTAAKTSMSAALYLVTMVPLALMDVMNSHVFVPQVILGSTVN